MIEQFIDWDKWNQQKRVELAMDIYMQSVTEPNRPFSEQGVRELAKESIRVADIFFEEFRNANT